MKRIGILVISILVSVRILAFSDTLTVYQGVIHADTVYVRQDTSLHSLKVRRDSLSPINIRFDLQPQQIPLVYLPDSLIRDTLRYEYTKIKDFA